MLFFGCKLPYAKCHALQKEFLAFRAADSKCGVERVVDRCCPFRNVRFGSDAETRLAAPGEGLSRDIVSQLLTNFGMDDLVTFVPRAFEGIPSTRLKRYAHQRVVQRS